MTFSTTSCLLLAVVVLVSLDFWISRNSSKPSSARQSPLVANGDFDLHQDEVESKQRRIERPIPISKVTDATAQNTDSRSCRVLRVPPHGVRTELLDATKGVSLQDLETRFIENHRYDAESVPQYLLPTGALLNRSLYREANRFAAQWLIPESPLSDVFCPSVDDDPNMLLKPVREFRRAAPPTMRVHVAECPHPTLWYVLSDPPDAALVPPPKRFTKRQRRLILQGHMKMKIPPLTQVATARAQLLLDVRQLRVWTELSTLGSTADDVVTATSPQVESCVRLCLGAPCCTAFQIANNATHRSCVLYATRNDEADAPDLLPGRRTAFLATRREFRPSLVDDTLRLTIYKGPNSIEPLTTADATLHKDVEIRLDGRLGVLRHDGYHGLVELRLHSRDSEHLKRQPFTVRLVDGVAKTNMEALGSLRQFAGEHLCLSVKGINVTQPASTAVLPVKEATACFIPGLQPAHAALHYGPQGTVQPSEMVTRDAALCAPLLRSNECCVRGLWYRLEDVSGARSVPVYSEATVESSLFTPHYDDAIGWNVVAPRAAVAVAGTSSAAQSLRHCVRFVDGFYSVANASGEGAFPSLVLQLNCGLETVRQLISEVQAAETVLAEHYKLWPESVVISLTVADTSLSFGGLPLDQLAACETLLQSDRLPVKIPRTSSADSQHSYIGFSLRANKRISFLAFQLRAFNAFAQQSVVALHISAQWKVSPTESKELAMLNASHPRTFVNPIRVRSSSWKATHIHAANFKFLLSCSFDVSHVVVWAANEILVRTGIVEYVKRFDMSAADRMDPRDGLAYAHNMFNIQWRTTEEHRLVNHDLWWFMPWDGVAGELIYTGILRNDRNMSTHRHDDVQRFPSHQLLLEGTFFNRQTAEEFIRVTDVAPLPEYCATVSAYGDSEIFPYLTMRHKCKEDGGTLRCGARVSTMLWRDPLYYATAAAVEECRCSPFDVPFGFKRTRRELQDPAILAVQAVLQNKTRAKLIRDDETFCQSLPHEIRKRKDDVRMTFFGL